LCCRFCTREAVGLKAINEAKNLLGEGIMSFEVRKELVSKLEGILGAALKPTEKIESIRMLHINGMPGFHGGASQGAAGGGSSGEAGLPNQLVQALLQYRLQVPMVEKMLAELNLNLDKGQILPTDLGETVSEKPKA
jgi:uncharacterized membrane protein YqiK